MATIGLDLSLPSGGYVESFAPTDPQFLMMGDSAITYTAVSGDTVTELGLWQYSGSAGSVVEVGVYRTDTLALIVSSNITLNNVGSSGRNVVTVSTPLVAGVTYAVALATVSIVGTPKLIGLNYTNGMADSALTGSSALANPFVTNGTYTGRIETFFATVTPGSPSPAVSSGSAIRMSGSAVRIGMAPLMMMPLGWIIERRRRLKK